MIMKKEELREAIVNILDGYAKDFWDESEVDEPTLSDKDIELNTANQEKVINEFVELFNKAK